MKAIAALVANGGNISDYMGKIIGGELPTTVAIPTTAGTGSEATQFTIITDTQNDVKMLLKGAVLRPGNVKFATGTTFNKSANVTCRNMYQYLK